MKNLLNKTWEVKKKLNSFYVVYDKGGEPVAQGSTKQEAIDEANEHYLNGGK